MGLREDNLNRLDGGTFDVLIVGGGINGAVSAAALSGHGASVALVERSDFASVTSQESSNLVWGGFKYLENYEIPLVFKLTRSRNRLMKAYPTMVTDLRFLATLDQTAPFPSWLAALGTVGYWGLGQFATKPPKYHRPSSVERLEPIIKTETASAAVEYGDAYLKDNDARFVWRFIRSALDLGAVAANYVALESAERHDGRWRVRLLDHQSDQLIEVTATTLVNAAGPYADRLNDGLKVKTEHRVVYSKGIHLVVPQLTTSERVLAFFDDSQRLFYVIPMAHRSVIGTTDTRTTDPDEGITDEDRQFLLKQINDRLDLETPLTEGDIISERCGVRPLVVAGEDDHTDIDWTTLSRKHEIEADAERGTITVFGGKITDCLNVGEEVVEAAREIGTPLRRRGVTWYGEPKDRQRLAFLAKAKVVGLDRAPTIEREPTMADVLWRRHGEAAHQLVEAIADDADQGQPVLAETDLLRAEVKLAAEREMVVRLDDFLRRRTKLSMIHREVDLMADPGFTEICATLNVEP